MAGITLIEVLVGFVIFTASLVAILDFVANQVHLRRRSAEGMERVSAVYEQVLRSQYGDGEIAAAGLQHGIIVERVSVQSLDDFRSRGQEYHLQQVEYRARSADGSFRWSVVEIH